MNREKDDTPHQPQPRQPEPRQAAPQETAAKQPEAVLRDGNLKASIWRNDGEKGPFYATTFARTWRDEEGQYRDSSSFVASDLLKLSELARSAYTRTNALRREDRAQDAAKDRGTAEDRAAFEARRSNGKDRESRSDYER